MLKIQNNKFQIKFTEINIRQRMFQEESYITVIFNTEFFPNLIDESVISGSIEIKLDLKKINSLDDLNNKVYNGDIGNVTISVNNNGVWEHSSFDNFELKINDRKGKILNFELETENCKLKTEGTIVSLYTTSSSNDTLCKNFDMKDFHNKPIIKKLSNTEVYKYYTK